LHSYIRNQYFVSIKGPQQLLKPKTKVVCLMHTYILCI